MKTTTNMAAEVALLMSETMAVQEAMRARRARRSGYATTAAAHEAMAAAHAGATKA